MHTYDAHGLLYLISSSGVMQFQEACFTVVLYARYILLQIYTITILATFRVTIFEFFHPGPQPISYVAHETLFCYMQLHNKASHSATYGKRLPPIFYVSNLVFVYRDFFQC